MTKNADNYAGGAAARYWFLGAAFFLTMFGFVMIYSASSITATVREGSSLHFFTRQVVASGLGLVAAWFLSRFDYRRFAQLAQPVWASGVALLVIVLVLGVVRGGARRWIPLGFMNLQPSELEKIACVLLVAALAVQWQRGKLPTKAFLWQTGIATAVPAALIILQPDLGTTVTLAVAVALVLLLAGLELKWATSAVAVGGLLAVVAIAVSPYRLKRVTAFLDPFADPLGKGYQSIQALYAFGSGGIDGVGLGLSRQKFFYLPEAHTDFILAIIGEEAGLLGSVAVVAAFAIFVWAGFKIAIGSKDPYGKLVAGGLVGMLAFQAFLNMAAVTGILPVTGKPLPFVSYGGSSMIVTMICVGIVLSVSQFGGRAPRAVRVRSKKEERPSEGAHERRRDRGPHLSRVERRGPSRRRA